MAVKQLITGIFVGLGLLVPTKSSSLNTCSVGNYFDNSLKTELQLNTINSVIIARFAPQESSGKPIELDKLARQWGYDHFNWVSYVNHDPYGMVDRTGSLLATPYNDPPVGGYQYETADKLPFYWDIAKCDRCQEHHHYQHPRITRKHELIFEDVPSDYRLQPGEAVEFVTHLVGVKNYDLELNQAEWNVINTFSWRLTNSVEGRGKVKIVRGNVKLNELSPSLIAAMQTDGGILSRRDSSPRLQPTETIAVVDKSESARSNCNI